MKRENVGQAPGQAPDTIVAPASGAGAAAVAVIRISGRKTRAMLERLCGPVPDPRAAALRVIGDPMIDRGLVLWFPAPASFTGEDMAELQVHGSRAVVQAVVDAVLAVEGTRLAEPGEFARRAFENGKVDLTEVEGLADLINAETEAQRRQALAQSEGSLRHLYEGWRADLLRAQALMEAGLDFADEADVAADASAQATGIAVPLLQAIDGHLADRSGERLREGFRVVIAGPPNAGKSSLLNALAKREVAIVSEEAGTTRDVIEVHLDLGGVPVILADTAGIREGSEAIEAEGIRRAYARAEDADLLLWLVDATEPVWTSPVALASKHMLIGLNKADIALQSVPNPPQAVDVVFSAKTGEGLQDLIGRLGEIASRETDSLGTVSLTRTRHRAELVSARDALQRFVNHDLPDELRAEELRVAAHHLGRLTGCIDVEEVLGAIFSEFCIGK